MEARMQLMRGTIPVCVCVPSDAETGGGRRRRRARR